MLEVFFQLLLKINSVLSVKIKLLYEPKFKSNQLSLHICLYSYNKGFSKEGKAELIF